MDTRFRRVAVFAGVAALATGAGVAVAAQGGETATSQQRAGAPARMDLRALADELGVSTDELAAAMDAARSAGPPHAGGDDALPAALAEELGVSVDKVTAALESVRPQGPAGGMRPPDGAAPPADGAAPPDGSSDDDTTTARARS